jgi:hypothetical protein
VSHFDDDPALSVMKRAMAAPGKFSTTWVGLSDEDVANILADGFATAQMQGWFPTYSYDPDSFEVTPDLSNAGIMLAVSYAAMKVLRGRLLELQSATSYKAGPVEASTTPQSNVLVSLLKSAEAEIDFIRERVASRVIPRIGDLTAVRLFGTSGFDFETTELPRFRGDLSMLYGSL